MTTEARTARGWAAYDAGLWITPVRSEPPRHPGPMLDVRQPFTTAEAARAGLSRAELTGPRFRPLLRGVYVDATTAVTTPMLLVGALKAVPAAQFVSHHSAAALHGLPAPRSRDLHLGTHASVRARRPHVRLHRYRHRAETMSCGDVTVTSPRQTFLDLSPSLGLVDAVALADAVLRAGRSDRTSLLRWLRSRERRLPVRAQEAAALASPYAESPQESMMRMFFHLSGFPPYEEQVSIPTSSGVRRVDGGYRATGWRSSTTAGTTSSDKTSGTAIWGAARTSRRPVGGSSSSPDRTSTSRPRRPTAGYGRSCGIAECPNPR